MLIVLSTLICYSGDELIFSFLNKTFLVDSRINVFGYLLLNNNRVKSDLKK